MKKSVIAILFSIVFLPLLGQQDIAFEKSKRGVKRRFKSDEVFKLDNGDVVFTGTIPRRKAEFSANVPVAFWELYSDFVVCKYSQDLTLKGKLHNKMELGNKRMQYVATKKIGKKYYVLFSFTNRKQHKNILFAREIDLEAVKLTKNIYKVAEVKLGNRLNFFGKYYFSYSPDGSSLLISYDDKIARETKLFGIEYIRTAKEKDIKQLNKAFNGWIVNEEMEVINTFTDVIFKKQAKLNGFAITSSFNSENGPLILFHNRPNKVFFNRVVTNRQFVLALINNNGDTVFHFPRLQQETSLIDLAVSFNPVSNNIVIGGPYTVTGKGANGIYMAELDKNTLEPLYELNRDFNDYSIGSSTRVLGRGGDGGFSRQTYEGLSSDAKHWNNFNANSKGYEQNTNSFSDPPKTQRERRTQRKQTTAQEKIEEKEMEEDYNSIEQLGKTVSIVFNSKNLPVLLMEKQSMYFVVQVSKTPNGQTTSGGERVIGYGDIIIAFLENDTNSFYVEEIKKYNGVDRNNKDEIGFAYTQDNDNLYIQYGVYLVKVNLLSDKTSEETSLYEVPYLIKKFKKYRHKPTLTFKVTNNITYINGHIYGFESRKKSSCFKLKIPSN